MPSRVVLKTSVVLFALLSAACARSQSAAPSGSGATNYASDAGSLIGDHLELLVTTGKFTDSLETGTFCAPAHSRLRVDNLSNSGTLAYVHFTRVGDNKTKSDACPTGTKPVRDDREYTIDRADLLATGPSRSGFVFGALVVPFKFRFGDHSISSSSTIAPYVGFSSTTSGSYGMSFTPVLSAGLGLVPVKSASGGTTETRPAFSAAIGLVVGSKKNTGFQAGVLLGRDVLSRSDRALEPAANKPWLSLYLGYAID